MPKLTKKVVDAIKADPDGRDRFVWDTGDGAIKGFGIRVKGTGTASYLVQYRNAEGRTRRYVLGRVGVLTPEAARKQAKDKLHEVSSGGDPSADRKLARKGMTVAELCDLYHTETEGRVKQSTRAMDKSRIERHVKPLIGQRAVAGLTIADLEKLQADIASGKTAKPRPETGRAGKTTGGKGVAGRTVGMLGTILEFARRRGLVDTNPARGVRKFTDTPRRRFLTIDEIKALGQAMRDAEAAGENKTAIAAVRALVLTGCRRAEILALPWAWLDTGARCIRFGDTKSGAQIRPLGASAVAVLAAQPRDHAGDWVFPAARSSDGEGHFVGLPSVLERLCARAGLHDVTPHTLRHTFASVAAELGFSELTIAGLLGHAARGVTQRYSHVPDRALLAAADAVAARIAAALDGKAAAEVVELRPVAVGA